MAYEQTTTRINSSTLRMLRAVSTAAGMSQSEVLDAALISWLRANPPVQTALTAQQAFKADSIRARS